MKPERLFFAVVLSAFFLRLGFSARALPHSDELNLMRIVDRVDLRRGIAGLPLHGDQHPPASVYWCWLGTTALGRNLIGYRLGSIALGTIAVAATGLIGWELFGATAGLLAAALLGLNEYHLEISIRAVEKHYLAFAALALLLTLRLAKAQSTPRWLALGAAFGLGALTKQTLLLWTLPAAAFLGRSLGWRALLRRGPVLAATIFLAFVSVDLAWNLFAAPPAAAESRGLFFQLSRIGLAGWSWGPAALYVRPLYYHRVESAICEYASMTTIPGLLLLTGALASCFTLKEREARFLQALGIGTFLFFCLGTDPHGEFWWADLTLIPFIVLTAAVWARLGARVPAALAAPVLLTLIPALKLLNEENNYHPLDWGAPPPAVVERFTDIQKYLFVQYPDMDFTALTAIGGVALPARARHERNLAAYREKR